MGQLLGMVNHTAITVSDLDDAMRFFEPWLDFMGYTEHERSEHAGSRLSINLNPVNQLAFNIWEVKGELAKHGFDVYAPGLHHLAFNADSYARVDAMAALVKELGGTILEGPGEFPFASDGYYAVYFLGPDNLKFEFVYMPALRETYR